MLKKRLDNLVQDKFPELSLNQITSLIMQGKVTVDEKIVTKPGTLIKEDSIINVNLEKQKYVSRAGFKLDKALEHFNIDVKDLVALDAGLSTGGFTDCLLQHGVKKVYGIEVGYGQAHEKIRADTRVIVQEQTNLRDLKILPELVDIVTLDLSFISVLSVMPSVTNLLKPHGKLIVLIKPQFEAEARQVERGGIVKDPQVHEQIIKKVTLGICEFGFKLVGVIESPILGADGNKEFLSYFEKNI